MPNFDDANREISVYMKKFVGRPATQELKDEVLIGVGEILFFYRIKNLEPYFDGPQLKFKTILSIYDKFSIFFIFPFGLLFLSECPS